MGSGSDVGGRQNFGIGPVKPWQQCGNVTGLDRWSGPDPDSRRGIAIGRGIKSHTFFLKPLIKLSCNGRLTVVIEGYKPRIGDF
jgi:hypothetical protein